MRRSYYSLWLQLFMVILPISAWGDEALIAVATNFSEVMGQLEDDFEVSSGHDVEMVAGSSGKLYAQIRNGAPFDVFLSADQERPRLLENNMIRTTFFG